MTVQSYDHGLPFDLPIDKRVLRSCNSSPCTSIQSMCLQGWLHKPTTVTVSPSTNMPLSVSHRFIATSPERKLAVLTRQIRADLEM